MQIYDLPQVPITVLIFHEASSSAVGMILGSDLQFVQLWPHVALLIMEARTAVVPDCALYHNYGVRILYPSISRTNLRHSDWVGDDHMT